VVFLKDGSRLEVPGVEKYQELKAYIEKRISWWAGICGSSPNQPSQLYPTITFAIFSHSRGPKTIAATADKNAGMVSYFWIGVARVSLPFLNLGNSRPHGDVFLVHMCVGWDVRVDGRNWGEWAKGEGGRRVDLESEEGGKHVKGRRQTCTHITCALTNVVNSYGALWAGLCGM
jgi:hypothetical protein